MFTPLVDQLIQYLCLLPGIGKKSAQRIAFYLLQRERKKGRELANSIEKALTKVQNCQRCRFFSEQNLCDICSNPKRDKSILCIVENPIDILAIEQTGSYNGLYFIMFGHLSPIEGLGHHELGFDKLINLLSLEQNIQEIIIATNHTIEGEATAHYIVNIANSVKNFKCTRIASGIPFGGELEYMDGNTLMQSLYKRTIM